MAPYEARKAFTVFAASRCRSLSDVLLAIHSCSPSGRFAAPNSVVCLGFWAIKATVVTIIATKAIYLFIACYLHINFKMQKYPFSAARTPPPQESYQYPAVD